MRGTKAEDGTIRVSNNGYQYTKTPQGWRLSHHLVAEKMLGRPLAENERVAFLSGNKMLLTPENIQVLNKGQTSTKRRIAQLEARKAEIIGQLEDLHHELANE